MGTLDVQSIIAACKVCGNDMTRESRMFKKRLTALLTPQQLEAMINYGSKGWKIHSISQVGDLEIVISNVKRHDYKIHILPDGHPVVY